MGSNTFKEHIAGQHCRLFACSSHPEALCELGPLMASEWPLGEVGTVQSAKHCSACPNNALQ